MFENIDVFKMSSAMAQHAGKQQAVVAQNVANADTPGYRARSMPDFAVTYVSGRAADGAQRATRATHLQGNQGGSTLANPVMDATQASPNSNQVSLETEILKSVDAKRQHDRALAIYKTSLSVLRSSLRTT